MSAFEDATRITKDGEGFVADVPDGWQQGRGAFGGVVVGLMIRALTATLPDRDRSLRTLSSDLLSPLGTGAARLRTSVVRAGKTVSVLGVDLEQNGEVVARASGTFATARERKPKAVEAEPPIVRPAMEIPVVTALGVPFMQHYEYRIDGRPPFTGAKEPLVLGWIRERENGAHDESAIAALVDTFFPTMFMTENEPCIAVTMGYTLQILGDLAALPRGEPLLYRGRGVATHGNFMVEFRELWHAGRIVALNQQTFAMLK